jgi:hypothetical protein
MRHLAIALLALSLLRPSMHAQGVPDAPVPASDPAWSGLQDLHDGQAIVITDTENRSVHCLFAGMIEDHLFCNPAGNPPGVGFRFDRAQVLSVDLDRPDAPQAQVRARDRNHPEWISSMIAGGIVVGLVASQKTTAGRAAEDGLIGAGVVGLIGAPMAFMPHTYAPPPYAGPIYGIGIPLRPTRINHSKAIFHLR